MTTRDDDLHNEDGTHRSTPVNADGRALEAHERRLRKHLLEEHRKTNSTQ